MQIILHFLALHKDVITNKTKKSHIKQINHSAFCGFHYLDK